MSQRKSIADSTKSILAEKLNETVTISRDAITSGGWSYPFLGILYFASHPSLYRAVAPILIKCLLASLGITGGLFIFTYLPQVAFCALFSGPFAFITAAVMVLGEAYAIILVVSKAFFLGQAQDQICALHTSQLDESLRTFILFAVDAVLLQQGNENLVACGREVKSKSGIKMLGRSITKPLNRFSKEGILRYIISLPLNSIPIVGTVMFFLYNGRSRFFVSW